MLRLHAGSAPAARRGGGGRLGCPDPCRHRLGAPRWGRPPLLLSRPPTVSEAGVPEVPSREDGIPLARQKAGQMHFPKQEVRSESRSNFSAALGIRRAPELPARVRNEPRSERVTECVHRSDPGRRTPPSPFLHLLRLPVTHAVYTHTHWPGCVNSWEAGLCNEVAATTRALPPASNHQSGGGGGGEQRWSWVRGGARGGRSAGDALGSARSGAGGASPAGWGARTRPRGWAGQEAARALPQAPSSAADARGGGGGKVPVTSGSRGSGRGAGPRGTKGLLIGARHPFTPSTMGSGRARRGSARPALPRPGR